MSNEDLQFHYFKVHDSDNDDKLDGIELATAMAHYHDEENGEKPEDYTEEVRLNLEAAGIARLKASGESLLVQWNFSKADTIGCIKFCYSYRDFQFIETLF